MENTTETTAQTQPEQQSPEAAPEEPPAEPPRKRSVLKIILIVIGVLVVLVLILVAAALFYLQSKGLTIDKMNPSKPVPTSTVTSAGGTTNNYRNNAYNFSMPYEKDLKISEKPYGFGVTNIEMRAEDTPKEYGPDFQMLIFPKAIGEQIGQDFDKYYGLADNTTQEIKDPSGASVKFTKLKNRTVNNLRAFEFTSAEAQADPDVEAEIGVYIELGTDIMVVSTAESNKAELEKMLADFKYPLK